jgi:ACS family hexuronate transporter-like MFS transporter
MDTPTYQRRCAWIVIFILFGGSVVNYIDRAVLAVVKPHLQKELSLSNTQYGLAVNVFLMALMVFSIVGGHFADRFGYRRTFPLAVIFWSIANMLAGMTRGLFSLCVFQGLLGIGQGGFYPISMRAVSEWFSNEDRAKPVGVLMCGISVGNLLTAPLAAGIALKFGWRAAFVATGALGLILVPLWHLAHRRIRKIYGTLDPAPALMGKAKLAAGAPAGITIGEALRTRKFSMILCARVLADMVWYFYVFWLPGYFQEARGFNMGMVLRLMWIPFFFGDLGALSGAWTSSALVRRGYGLNFSRKIVLVASASCCIIGASTFLAQSQYLALALASLAVFGHLSWGSNLHTVITEICPERHVSVLYGITGAAATLVSGIAQPVIGRVVDSYGYGPAFLGTAGIFVLAIAMLLGAGKIERIERKQPPVLAAT